MPLDYAKKRNVLRARARFLHHRSPVPLLIASPTLSNNAGTNVRDGSIESCVCFRDLLLPRDNVVISGAELQQKRVWKWDNWTAWQIIFLISIWQAFFPSPCFSLQSVCRPFQFARENIILINIIAFGFSVNSRYLKFKIIAVEREKYSTA